MPVPYANKQMSIIGLGQRVKEGLVWKHCCRTTARGVCKYELESIKQREDKILMVCDGILHKRKRNERRQ